jgi:hypothetical protein
VRLAFAIARKQSGHRQSVASDGSGIVAGSAAHQQPLSIVHENSAPQPAQISRRGGGAGVSDEVGRSGMSNDR